RLQADERDHERARSGGRLGDGKEVGELAIGHPAVLDDGLPPHLREDGVPSAEGDERERPEERDDAEKRREAHARSSRAAVRACGQNQAIAIGASPATTHGIRQWRTCTAANAAAASSAASGRRANGLASLAPIAIAMPAATATAPRSADWSAGSSWSWKYATPSATRIANGTTVRPATAASAPRPPAKRVPRCAARFTWLAPGRRRASASPARKSSIVTQRFRSTTSRCVQSARPPPKLESAMRAKVQKISAGPGGGAGGSSAGRGSPPGARSLMLEVGIVRQLAGLVRVDGERVRRFPVLGVVPVVLEDLGEALDAPVIGHENAELASEVERASVDVHRADERLAAVDHDQLRVQLGVLLAPHLRAEALQDAKRREGVRNVPGADAVLAAAEDPDVDAPVLRLGEAVEDRRVDVLGMLDVEPVAGGVDELGHQRARVRGAPGEAGSVVGLEVLAPPVGLEAALDLVDVERVVRDDPVVARLREVLLGEVEGRDDRALRVDDDRLLVRDREAGVRPGDRDARALEPSERLVVGAVARRAVRVQHDLDRDPALVRAHDLPEQRR